METPYYPNLEVGYVFSRGWEVFRENMALVFAIFLVQVVVIAVSSLIPFLPLLISGPLQVGVYFALVKMVRGEEVELKSMFDGFQEFGRSLGVYLLYSLAVLVGLILLVVPGIIVAIGLFPALYLVLDASYGIGDTLQEAWEMTKGHKWQLFVISLAIFGTILVGLLALVIGVIFAAALAYVVMAVVYDELARASAAAPDGIVE